MYHTYVLRGLSLRSRTGIRATNSCSCSESKPRVEQIITLKAMILGESIINNS